MGARARFQQVTKVLTLALTFTLSISSVTSAAQAQEQSIKVCAVPQLYQALSYLNKHSPVPYTTVFATANELYAQIANASINDTISLCDVVLSSDERLPISLIRSQKALGNSLQPFTRAPLVWWSADKNLFKGHDPHWCLNKQTIKSLAIASPRLTPVGFATAQVLKRSDLKTQYLKDKTYRSDQEYQVYSMVASGNVHSGIISKPLIASVSSPIAGSYYQIPRTWHSDIQYYVLLLNTSKDNQQAHKFMNYLVHDTKAQQVLSDCGFAPLTPD